MNKFYLKKLWSRIKVILYLLFFFPLSSDAQVTPFQYEINKKAEGTYGAVVTAHPLATQVGLEILKKGGNAFDAAIATQFALAVVYPGAGNLGGGGFMIAYTADKKALAFDYREKAPLKAYRDMYVDSSGKARTDLSQNGHLASGVPGTVSGLFAIHKYANLPFEQLILPAIALAENGFVITEAEARNLNTAKNDFIRYNTHLPVFVKEEGWKAGDTLIQTDLANTLKRIQKKGRKGFYKGITAKLIAEEMSRGKGIISKRDLRKYRTIKREPMVSEYRGYQIIGMPLPSSGGLLIQQMLGMLSDYNISELGFQSAEMVQLMTEIERRAYADRAEFLGDADFINVPMEKLTSPEYLRKRMQDFVGGKAGNSQTTSHGNINTESEETTHLSIYDKWGNAVTVTTTLNGNYGSKTVIKGAGFLMNNQMDDFSVKPGEPNLYGAIGNEANAIAAGKRMLSSMTPTIVLNQEKPFLIIGTPGGTTIPTQIFQSLVNLIDFNLSLEEVINSPKCHHQWYPDIIFYEKEYPAMTIEQLKAMGYECRQRGPIGRTEGILIRNNKIQAVGDKRGDDDARAF
jgi:gamma-glutamyltranspeptidase/glutathione hydrolase